MQNSKNDPFNQTAIRLLLELLTTRHLSLAAQHLGLSISSASRRLDALRTAFTDPLFIVTNRGLVPTPVMLSMEGDLLQANRSLEQLLTPKRFDPATAEKTFHIAIRGLIETSLVLHLIAELGKRAPHCRLEHTSRTSDSFASLLSGKLDFVISTDLNIPPMLRHMPLFPIKLGIMISDKHPLLREFHGQAPTINLLAKQKRVELRVSHVADGSFDEQIFGNDKANCVVSTNEPILAAEIVSRSELVAVAPQVGVRTAPTASGVTWMPLPKELQRETNINTVLVWSEEHHQDPANIWMRSVIREWTNALCTNNAPSNSV